MVKLKYDLFCELSMATHSSFRILAPIHKSVGSDGKIQYVAVASSQSVDRDNERMTKSVLTKAANELVGKPVLFNHDTKGTKSLALGGITESWMDGEKLMIKWFPSEAESVKDALIQVEEGILGWMSVGGKATSKSYSTDFDGEEITAADFFEVSAVYVPANPDARILGAMAKMFTEVEKDHEEGEEHKCSSCGKLHKGRYGTAWNDANAVSEENKPSEDQMAPVVPKKKKKVVNGQLVDDDEVYDKARAMGMEHKPPVQGYGKEAVIEVAKENGPNTPNEPKAIEGGDAHGGGPSYLAARMAEIEAQLAKIRHEHAALLSSLNTRGSPNMGSDLKSAETVDLQKSLEKKIQEADAAAKPAGLAVVEVAKSQTVEQEEDAPIMGAYKI